MVVAKRAVGSEYIYQAPVQKTYQKKIIRVERSVSAWMAVCSGVLLINLLFFIGLSYTYLKASKARMHLELSQMEQVNQQIIWQNEKLRLETEKLKSLDRIEQIASLQMGMTKNPEVNYLVLDSTVDVPQLQDITGAQPDQKVAVNASAGRKIIEGIVGALKERGIGQKG